VREIKFRCPMYLYDGRFSHFTYWGRMSPEGELVSDMSCFSSPGQSNTAYSKSDEQFTGLHDQDGVEIYEGDVVIYAAYPRVRFTVEYGFGQFFGSGEFDNMEFMNTDMADVLVIGNIHENPEVLEEAPK
jgi:hypothetical protein